MKYQDNIVEVSQLQPDYLGFIFYGKSQRFFQGNIPKLPSAIKKVGVFVDASLGEIIEKIEKYHLDLIQLHGEESPEFCLECHAKLVSASHPIEIIKVFSIKDDFNFQLLESYDTVCDYYLFDTKGKLPGGNGYTFNWNVLKNYPSKKPFFLSGGIGLEEEDNLKSFLKTEVSKYCHAIDVNSKFESEPGLKKIDLLKEFKNKLSL